MYARDLDQTWSGRTIAIHEGRTTHLGKLTAVEMQYGLIPNHGRLHQAHASGPVDSVSINLDQDGVITWHDVDPETVVVEQEVGW